MIHSLTYIDEDHIGVTAIDGRKYVIREEFGKDRLSFHIYSVAFHRTTNNDVTICKSMASFSAAIKKIKSLAKKNRTKMMKPKLVKKVA